MPVAGAFFVLTPTPYENSRETRRQFPGYPLNSKPQVGMFVLVVFPPIDYSGRFS